MSLHLLKDPDSAPSDCTALRNDSNSVNLGSANASSGSVSISSVSVTSARFTASSSNYLCLHGATSSTSSPVTQFTVSVPTGTISLSQSSGNFGSTFTASGTNFSGSESVSLHLLSNPGSAPADCSAIRDDSNSVNLGSANASSGSVSISSVSVTSARFVGGNNNHLCLYGNTSTGSSAVTQFTVSVPTGTISLSPSSGLFSSTFTATGANFSGSESVSLHLLSNPSSVPADCSAIRGDSNSVSLSSANASSGSVSISSVSVTSSRFVGGNNNHLCLYGNTSTGSSAVTQFTVTGTAGLVVSPTLVNVNEGESGTFTVKLAAAPSSDVTVSVTSADTEAVTVRYSSLTFTTTNWNTQQTVTAEGEEDLGWTDESVTLTLSASGGGYAGVSSAVLVTVTDDEVNPGEGEIILSLDPSLAGGAPRYGEYHLLGSKTLPETERGHNRKTLYGIR